MTTHLSMTGFVRGEPVLSRTSTGKAVVNFTVRTVRRWFVADKEQTRETVVDCVAYHELAENIAATLTDGMRVVVSGYLDHRIWRRPDGSEGWKLECTVDEASPSLRANVAVLRPGAGQHAGSRS